MQLNQNKVFEIERACCPQRFHNVRLTVKPRRRVRADLHDSLFRVAHYHPAFHSASTAIEPLLHSARTAG